MKLKDRLDPEFDLRNTPVKPRLTYSLLSEAYAAGLRISDTNDFAKSQCIVNSEQRAAFARFALASSLRL